MQHTRVPSCTTFRKRAVIVTILSGQFPIATVRSRLIRIRKADPNRHSRTWSRRILAVDRVGDRRVASGPDNPLQGTSRVRSPTSRTALSAISSPWPGTPRCQGNFLHNALGDVPVDGAVWPFDVVGDPVALGKGVSIDARFGTVDGFHPVFDRILTAVEGVPTSAFDPFDDFERLYRDPGLALGPRGQGVGDTVLGGVPPRRDIRSTVADSRPAAPRYSTTRTNSWSASARAICSNDSV